MGTCQSLAGSMKAVLALSVLSPALLATAQPQDLLAGLANFIGNAGNAILGGASPRSFPGSGNGNDLRNRIQGLINNPLIQKRLLCNENNPCDGAAPSQVICTDGASIPFSTEVSNPCSASERPETIVCPNGNRFNIRDTALQTAQRNGIPTCGNDDPSYCECSGGEKFYPDSSDTNPQIPCGGNPLAIERCICPDGSQITKNDFISRIVPLVQQTLLGEC